MGDGTIKEKLEHPVAGTLTTIAVVAAALTGVGTITGWYDAGHTSEAELSVVVEKTLENEHLAKCSRLDIRISLTEQAIWQMEQAGDNSQRLIEKRRELRRMLDQFRKLNCSSILE